MKDLKLIMNIDMEDFIEINKINIFEFSEKINNLGKEENKKDFLKNYNDYKTMIENIDDFINENKEKNNFDSLELPELLSELENITKNNDNLKTKNLQDLLNIKKIISSINNKINNSEFSINKLN